MNRELKFRAWDFENSAMVYPEDSLELTGNEGYSHIEQSFIGDKRLTDSSDVYNKGQSPCVLMQFVGLKDKKGKEIYEGDILEYHFRTKEQFSNDLIWRVDKENGDIHSINRINTIEIIGNIYETPELIK